MYLKNGAKNTSKVSTAQIQKVFHKELIVLVRRKNNFIHNIPHAEFYITNVCNLACSNCNRLNNYKFKGSQLWEDLEPIYRKWSNRLNIKKINILGGEPTLSSDFQDWCIGIRELWKDSQISVVTNGTRLDKIENLYSLCKDYQIELDITSHGRERFPLLYNFICNFLQKDVKISYQGNFDNWKDAYNDVKDPSWPHCENIDDYYNLPHNIQKECKQIHKISPEQYLINSNGVNFVDCNNVKISLGYAENFVTAPLKYSGNNKFTVYNSDPTEAHNVCISKYCHHFMNGLLYKCHHVALLPEFMEQYFVEISESDKKLLDDYIPANVNLTDDNLKNFLDNLKNPIDQCKLCPSKLEQHDVTSSYNKPKIKKLSIIDTKQI